MLDDTLTLTSTDGGRLNVKYILYVLRIYKHRLLRHTGPIVLLLPRPLHVWFNPILRLGVEIAQY
jgi:hypothetical protein